MQQQLESPARPAPADGQTAEDLYTVLRVLHRNRLLIAVCTVVCLVAGLAIALNMSTSYQATARLLVLEQGGRLLPGGVSIQSVRGGEDSLATHVMIIRSPRVAETAKDDANVAGLTVESLIDHLTVTIPDPAAKVIQVAYSAGDREQARKVLQAVIDSYKQFIDKNFQSNTTKAVELFIKARNDIDAELKEMQDEYKKVRQAKPSYTGTDNGPSFAQRRVDRWEQERSRARTLAIQLKAQEEMARKMFREGADPATVAAALSRATSLMGGDPARPPADPAAPAGPGQSDEHVEAQLGDAVFQRMMAERLVEHLRAGRDSEASDPAAAAQEVARLFNDDPEVHALHEEIRKTEETLHRTKGLARVGNDPAVRNAAARLRERKGHLARLWQERQPVLMAEVTRAATNEELRKSESQLKVLTAREEALRETLERVKEERLDKARRERERLVQQGGGPGKSTDLRVRQLDDLIARLQGEAEVTAAPQGEAKVRSMLESIALSVQALEAVQKEIQVQFQNDLKEAKDDEANMLTDSNLRNNIERQRILFNSVVDQLNQAKQAQLVNDVGSTTCQVINPPGVRENRMQRALVAVAGLLAGLLLGSAVAFLRDQMDPRIRTLPEIRRALNFYVLGIIPGLTREQLEACGSIGLICHTLPRSFVSEAYRLIRTNFECLRRSHDAQVVLVTSPNMGDGKSTVASNLATSLAHAGRKVLLIDGDMRRPVQHEVFGLGRDRGLPHTLKDILPLGRVVQPSAVENLDLLLAGPEVSNPAELLAAPQLAQAIKEMRQTYDVVIIDTPPLLAVADASILAQSVDGIVLVVRTTTTCRPDVERMVELLQTLGTPVLGTVINGMTASEMGLASGSGYGYGYGSRGVYGTYGDSASSANGGLGGPVSLPGVTNGPAEV
jgi:capsular exopolysaccharide synthesis family protein